MVIRNGVYSRYGGTEVQRYGVQRTEVQYLYICRAPRRLARRRTAKYSQVPAAGLIDKLEITGSAVLTSTTPSPRANY